MTVVKNPNTFTNTMMKKAGSNSKDRLAKSGNIKKRSGAGGTPTSALSNIQSGVQMGASSNVGSVGWTASPNGPAENAWDPLDLPVVIWPEWSDSDIATEKWATKHIFEDPDFGGSGGLTVPVALTGSTAPGTANAAPQAQQQTAQPTSSTGMTALSSLAALLPRSLRGQLDNVKRPVELFTDMTPIGITTMASLDDAFYSPPNATLIPLNFGNPNTGAQQQHADAFRQSSIIKIDENFELDSVNVHPSTQDFPPPSPINDQPPLSPLIKTDMDHMIPPPVTISDDETKPHSAADQQQISNTSQDEENIQGTSKFFQYNKHLMASEFMKSVIFNLHFLFEQSKSVKSSGLVDEFAPWDRVFPKGKDGLPSYNPMGKYAVKLYWLGCWRKVLVDDRMPVDTEGKCLFVGCPSGNEIWPLILTKALLKVAVLSSKDMDSFEFGDFDVFHTLCSWIPERIYVNSKQSLKLWSFLLSLNLRSPSTLSNMSASGRAGSVSCGLTAKDKIGSSSSSNGQSADRSALGSAGKGQKLPYVFLLAYRDGEELNEKIDLNSFPYFFRITDVRETVIIPGATIPKETELTFTNKIVKLRGYFTCGTRQKKPDLKKATEEFQESENTEYWVQYSDFCKAFRFISIFHGPSTFKYVKTIQHILDPSKQTDTLRLPQILYFPDSVQCNSTLLSLSTYGKVKEQIQQTTSVIVEEYNWKYSSVNESPVMRIATNAILSTFLKVGYPQSFRFVIDCQTAYSISLWSREEFYLEDEGKYCSERLGLNVRDIDDVIPIQPPNTWFILFKIILNFSKPTILSANLFVPDVIANFTCLRFFDNDTNSEIPQVFYVLKPRLFIPNKSGYTLVADTRSPSTKIQLKYKLRLISSPENPADMQAPVNPTTPVAISTPSQPGASNTVTTTVNTTTAVVAPPQTYDMIITKSLVFEFEDFYIPNKYNILFRYQIKVKETNDNCISTQLLFSFPTVLLKLTVFDNNVEIFSVKGRGVVSIYALNLGYSEVSEPSTGGKETGNNTLKSGKPDKEAVKSLTTLIPKEQSQSQPRHKYILQATIEHSEFEVAKNKPSSALSNPNAQLQQQLQSSQSETTRPQSRGASKPTNSAKKKKPGPQSAGSANEKSGQEKLSSADKYKESTSGSGVSGGQSFQDDKNNEPMWRLKVFATDQGNLQITKDTEKEDRYKAIKDSWEVAQPGRASKAREVRENYNKQVEVGIIKPVLLPTPNGKEAKPWMILKNETEKTPLPNDTKNLRNSFKVDPELGDFAEIIESSLGNINELNMSEQPSQQTQSIESLNQNALPQLPALSTSMPSPQKEIPAFQPAPLLARILKPDEQIFRKQLRDKIHAEYAQFHTSVINSRTEDKEYRSNYRQLLQEKNETKIRESEKYRDEDLARRESYRVKVLKEIEENNAKIAAMEAAKAAELAAEMGALDEPVVNDKSKKKAGKK
ncbi:hypothetical protein HK098_006389 [Nowakowskiella sp. JEL0407]|nr:hypothetical protein HK098_006389 [Nowakowskiella sp. JEL0407]